MTASDRPEFAFPSSVLFREVDGEMVLLDLASEAYFGLNAVGADMVTRLTTQPRVQALASLGQDYEVDAAVLEQDADELVAQLVAAGLLEPATHTR